jgi:hypothetical protein
MGLNQPFHSFSGYLSYPGQVPGVSTPLSARPRIDPEIQRTLTEMPAGVTLDRMLDRPVLRAQDAVGNLGLTKALESTLSLRIQKEAATALNQLAFQKAINATMMEMGFPPDLQSVINARAARFYRSTLQKAGRSEHWTLRELSELKKGKTAVLAHPGQRMPEARASQSATRRETSKNERTMLSGENKERDQLRSDRAELTHVDKSESPEPSERYSDPQGAGYFTGRPSKERNMNATYPKLHRPGEKKRVKDLQKGSGEGSRGGKVIGHTSSGKAIYDSPGHDQRPKKQVHNTTWAGIEHGAQEFTIEKAEKAAKKNPGQFQETGGKFVMRVKKEGKTRYYYDEDKYKAEHGEHVSGDQARVRHIHDQVFKTVEGAGCPGCDVSHFRELVKQFGAGPVHDSVRRHVNEGTINFQGGKFQLGKKKTDAVKKSFFIVEKE